MASFSTAAVTTAVGGAFTERDLIRKITKVPNEGDVFSLPPQLLDRIKTLCRDSDHSTESCATYLIADAQHSQALVRWRSFAVMSVLFDRSKAFRTTLCQELRSIAIGGLLINGQANDKATNKFSQTDILLLQDQAKRLIEVWDHKFGKFYPELHAFARYLRESLKLAIPDIRQQLQASLNNTMRRREHVIALNTTRLQAVLASLVEHKENIKLVSQSLHDSCRLMDGYLAHRNERQNALFAAVGTTQIDHSITTNHQSSISSAAKQHQSTYEWTRVIDASAISPSGTRLVVQGNSTSSSNGARYGALAIDADSDNEEDTAGDAYAISDADNQITMLSACDTSLSTVLGKRNLKPWLITSNNNRDTAVQPTLKIVSLRSSDSKADPLIPNSNNTGTSFDAAVSSGEGHDEDADIDWDEGSGSVTVPSLPHYVLEDQHNKRRLENSDDTDESTRWQTFDSLAVKQAIVDMAKHLTDRVAPVANIWQQQLSESVSYFRDSNQRLYGEASAALHVVAQILLDIHRTAVCLAKEVLERC